ncbi:single-stranded DNA-binding protein [Arthrobacter sp. H-02-3]|uniref:single-stranded DNA-binding protein n=1 Tax=Arthrobacter sp. H-02-3 TaxID=2703675 RepID=UPI000DD249BF|nr:single-stranded DNA-binding protein [Arthrobacter sp. H-02-3]PVZ52343.1 single-stranded DNA-binding protein [Arthrobacter sp. H-02-3]
MSAGTGTTVIGHVTADPELRFTGSGTAVARFTIASTPGTFDAGAGQRGGRGTMLLAATAWRGTAEHAAATLTRGMRVIAIGTLKPRTYTTKAGEERTVVEFEVEDIGPSLRHSTAEVTRTGPGPEQDEELPPDRFALSAREYGDDDAWFGLAANPTGHINVPAPDPGPALQGGTMTETPRDDAGH